MSQIRPRGRKPTIDRAAVFALNAQGWNQCEIADHLGVGQAAISKIIAKGDHEPAEVQPLARDDMELVPPVTVRTRVLTTPPVAQAPPPAKAEPGSEWRGVPLAPTLAERFNQLRTMHGDEVARDFARREAWHLTRTGVSVEAISQQFDLPVAEVEALVRDARERALATIDKYDARLSLSAALEDITVSRREALRVLNSASASPSARSSARHMLLRLAQAETELAIAIEAYRKAHGLGDRGDADTGDVGSIDFWLNRGKDRR